MNSSETSENEYAGNEIDIIDKDEESSSNESTVRRKKKKYSQKYNSKWETEAKYKEWLGPNKNNIHEAICRICNKSINISAGKNQLKRHQARTSHIKAFLARKYQPSMPSFANVQSFNSMELLTKKADLYLAAFVAEHNVPFKIMEHMPQLIKKICVDSEIAKKIACSRTKVTAIVRNVIGQYNFEEICGILNNIKFSLIIDESTDRTCTKHLCMVARFLQDKKVIDCFLGLIPLKDATAEDLYDKVTAFFNLNKIPYKANLIGFASDGASVMVGTKNSFSSRLISDIPHIFLMKCICHSFHLCASNACTMLPSAIEELTRDIYNYFLKSSKRIETLKEFQKFANVKIHKILHPAQTRWLSVESVVVRILEQYEALKLFFIDASVNSDRTVTAGNILHKLQDPLTKMFLMFLEFVLPIFNNLNREFQSANPKIHNLHKKMCTVYKTLLECFIKRTIIQQTPISLININNPQNYLPLEEIYMGAKILALLHNKHFDSQQLHVLRTRCLSFYVEGARQIRKRYNFDNIVLKSLEVLDPEIVKSGSVPSIINLCNAFPNLIPEEKFQTIDNEWRLLRNVNISCEKYSSVEEFWIYISEMKYSDESLMFGTLGPFMLNLLCLPHSSANVERVFSKINLMKTKQRNKLSTMLITGLLHTKTYLKNKECFNLNIEKHILKRINNEMYKPIGDESDETDIDED